VMVMDRKRFSFALFLCSFLHHSAHGDSGDFGLYTEKLALLFGSREQGLDPRIADELKAIKERQKPAISPSDLSQLFKSTREAFVSGDLRINATRKAGNGELKGEDYRMVFSGPKRLLEMTRSSLSSDFLKGASKSTAKSYDGQVVRHFRTFAAAESQGGLSKLESLTAFTPADVDLFAKMMLSDSEVSYGAKNLHIDLPFFLEQDLIVFDEGLQVNGYECIALTNGGFDLFVSPLLNFSVVRILRRGRNFEAAFERNLSEFTEPLPGVHIPTKIVERDGERPVLTLTVTKISLNESIDDAVFTGVIPPGTHVSDLVRNLVYTQARPGTIGAILDNVIVQKPTSIWIYVLPILFGVVCAVYLWLQKKK